MPDKSTGVAYKAFLWIILLGCLVLSLRAGYHVALWTAYTLLGETVEAVIEESSPYMMTVRKPRPARYVERWRGTYGFDLRQDAGNTAHFTGKFNDSYFLSIDRADLRKGDRLMVRYLSFKPSWSRPEEEFGLTPLTIAGFLFLTSAVVGGACALLLRFFRRVPGKL